jgi:hypothetical protein
LRTFKKKDYEKRKHAGETMYPVEGPENGFLNIPESIYWALE